MSVNVGIFEVPQRRKRNEMRRKRKVGRHEMGEIHIDLGRYLRYALH